MEVGWWCEVRGARWDAKGWEPYLQDHLTHGHELLLLKCLPLGRVQGLGTLGRLEPLVQSTTASVCRLGGLLCGVDVCLFGWVCIPWRPPPSSQSMWQPFYFKKKLFLVVCVCE